jgi:iron complex transport system substrate-binding protein
MMSVASSIDFYPQRIVCLTEETTETLYLLGEQHRIVGISGFTVRPPQARKEKPKVSTFLDAKTEEILDLQPDLVIGFSDIQAGIAKTLIEQGITVWVNNHRSVQGILKMMVQLGALVGKQETALQLVAQIQADIGRITSEVALWRDRPKVYFEEWYDPLISGIRWVSEIVELAGGIDIFPEYSRESLAKNRIIAGPQEVVKRNPDILLASWCGKMFKKEKVLQRPGWSSITAVQGDDLYEIKSAVILQPGPAALMEGLPLVHGIFKKWRQGKNS